MIALKITIAIIFAFFLFMGVFIAIANLIFDRVEISDHVERMRLQQVRAQKNVLKRKRKILH